MFQCGFSECCYGLLFCSLLNFNFLHAQIPGNADTEDLLSLNPDRIGHGTFLHPENGGKQNSIDFIIRNKIPIGEPRHLYITYVCLVYDVNL